MHPSCKKTLKSQNLRTWSAVFCFQRHGGATGCAVQGMLYQGRWRQPALRGGKVSTDMGGFLKWWYLTTIGFPTENDQHLGWRLGVAPCKERPTW